MSSNDKKIIAVIPARYESSRFPGKPLAKILEKPMIQWVYERVLSVEEISEVYVATDDKRIFDVVENFGGRAVMTGECSCGTDRVYEASKEIDCDIVLNIQGDEPLIKREMIQDLIEIFKDENVKMGTLKKRMQDNENPEDPNIVKVITNINDEAIYFSRFPIPYNRERTNRIALFKHIGVYGYSKGFLKEFVSLPSGKLELIEKLEQLRAIENGYNVIVKETLYQSIGVDLPEHISLIEQEITWEKNE